MTVLMLCGALRRGHQRQVNLIKRAVPQTTQLSGEMQRLGSA